MQWADRIGRRLKLRDLHVLMIVAESGSMAKAADRLSISQPVVSKAIAELEKNLGVRLFDRRPQGIQTTPFGVALLRRAATIFDELRRGVKDLEFLSDPDKGELRVGCSEGLAAGLMCKVLAGMSIKYPGIAVHVSHFPARDIATTLRALRDREVDLVMGRVPTEWSTGDLVIEHLFEDPVAIMVGKTSYWARRKKLSLADLADGRWVLPPSPQFLYALMSREFHARRLRLPKRITECFSVQMRIQLVSQTDFVTLLPHSLSRFGSIPLKALDVDFSHGPAPRGIIMLKDILRPPGADRFLECLRGVARLVK